MYTLEQIIIYVTNLLSNNEHYILENQLNNNLYIESNFEQILIKLQTIYQNKTKYWSNPERKLIECVIYVCNKLFEDYITNVLTKHKVKHGLDSEVSSNM